MTPSPLLSVLDLVPLASGQGSAGAIQGTVALAQHAEALGYARYWLAEHHNMQSLIKYGQATVLGFRKKRSIPPLPPGRTFSNTRSARFIQR